MSDDTPPFLGTFTHADFLSPADRLVYESGKPRVYLPEERLSPSEETTVPSGARGWRESAGEYVRQRTTRENLSARYLRELGRVLASVGRELEGHGLGCSPAGFSDPQIDYLLHNRWSPTRLSPKSRIYEMSVAQGFLKRHGNLALENRHIRIRPTTIRPLAWYTEEQARRVLDCAQRRGIVSYGLIALELTMGLRRCEVLRLTVADVSRDPIRVLGKGRDGGKPREVEMSSTFRGLLPELLRHRADVHRDHRGHDPGYLFGHVYHRGVAKPLGKTRADQLTHAVLTDAGVRQGYNLGHSLRATFGRSLWARGVPIEVIADLMGHESTEMTRKYLRLGTDDRRKAMAVLDGILGA